MAGQELLVRVRSQKTADKGLDRKRLVAGLERHIFASATLYLDTASTPVASKPSSLCAVIISCSYTAASACR